MRVNGPMYILTAIMIVGGLWQFKSLTVITNHELDHTMAIEQGDSYWPQLDDGHEHTQSQPLKTSPKTKPKKESATLILTRCHEDVTWLRHLSDTIINVYIHEKCNDTFSPSSQIYPPIEDVPLEPNAGEEASGFLKYIMDRMKNNDMPDIMFFMQADTSHTGTPQMVWNIKHADIINHEFLMLNPRYIGIETKTGCVTACHMGLCFYNLYQRWMNTTPPEWIHTYSCGAFMARKERIMRNPIERYAMIYEDITTGPQQSYCPTENRRRMEAGVIERMWSVLLDEPNHPYYMPFPESLKDVRNAKEDHEFDWVLDRTRVLSHSPLMHSFWAEIK